MPELPEVETIVRELNRVLPGKTIEKVEVLRDTVLRGVTREDFQLNLRGKTFQPVQRRGKYLLFPFLPDGYLVAHLRMSGKFAVGGEPATASAHLRIRFLLGEGKQLLFLDTRCLGTLNVVEHPDSLPGIRRMGVEPLSGDFTEAWLIKALSGSSAVLKNWMMNQQNIAGLGNIYVAEILFDAGLSPLRQASAVTPREAKRLYRGVKAILEKALEANGTTISDYKRVDDKSGEFQEFLRVYGKMNQPCVVCRSPIARIRQQQRSTYYCSTCQT